MDELGELLGVDRRKWDKSLAKLVDEERVKRTGKGSRGSPYRHLGDRSDRSRSPISAGSAAVVYPAS